MKFFQTNISIHNINTKNKHHLHRPNVNLPCFQKSAFYAGIKIFNSLPPSFTILKHDKAKFKATLRKYLYTHSLHSVDKLFMCKDDLQYHFCKMSVACYNVNWYICVFMTCFTFYCLYDTLMDPLNE